MSPGPVSLGTRSRSRLVAVALALTATLAFAPVVRADEAADRVAELERQVEELRAAVAALQAQPAAPPAAAPADPAAAPAAIPAEELARRLDLLAAEIEALKIGEAAATADRSDYGFGPAASKVYREAEGLSIGGYGEVVYEQFDGRNDAGGAGKNDASDALRAIVYVGYKFSDKWLFNSEIEFEHGGQETFLEFAYLDYLWRPELNFRFGHLLVPMGLVNELHEPTIFLGVRRPLLEQTILPSTWHENGLGVFGSLGPVEYRSYLMNGFRANGFTAAGLRGGRQAGNRANSEDIAWVTRVDYRPIDGLLVGGSAYFGDSGQGLTAGGRDVDVSTQIFEAHVDYRFRGLELRGLWAQADLDDVARLNNALGLTGSRSIGEEMGGWYAQVGYDVLSQVGAGDWQLTPFVRLEEVDTQKAVPSGFAKSGANDQEILTYGLELQPEERLVFKLDFQDFDNAAGTGLDQWSLGIGYVF